MKCIYNESQGYFRVTDEVAEKKVKTGVFRYAPKSAWKESLKQTTVEVPVIDKAKAEIKKSNKLAHHLKLKEKQR